MGGLQVAPAPGPNQFHNADSTNSQQRLYSKNIKWSRVRAGHNHVANEKRDPSNGRNKPNPKNKSGLSTTVQRGDPKAPTSLDQAGESEQATNKQ